MGEGGNLLTIFLCINIVLYIGLTGMGSDKGNLIKNDLFSSGFLNIGDDRILLGDDIKEKPELQSSNVLSDILSFKVFDVILIVWKFIMTLFNIITLPFTLMYNLFFTAQIVGRIMTLLIFAPLTIGYIYALISFIKGVGN